jgi:hypothetical protein
VSGLRQEEQGVSPPNLLKILNFFKILKTLPENSGFILARRGFSFIKILP